MKFYNQSLFFLLFFSALSSLAQTPKPGYKIANTFSVAGDGGWDYLAMDEAGSRIFVSHGDMTQVVDAETGKLLATIPDTKGVHGIALDADDNKVFISNGKDTSVTVVNFNTLEFIAKVKVTGVNPDAILYDAFSHKVFVFNGRTANATVLDARSNKILGTIELMGKPEFSVSDGKGKVFVNIEDKGFISVINATTLFVENSWPVNPGTEPSGLAIDTLNHRLFTVCDNQKMIVMDSRIGKILAVMQIGANTDGCVFDPVLKRAYSANGEGNISVIQEADANKFQVIEKIITQKGARTICINTKTNHLYLPTATYGEKPAATEENQHPRAAIVPGSFRIIDICPAK